MSASYLGVRDAGTFIAAIDAELDRFTREQVDLMRKGRVTQQEVDYVAGLIRDIRSDLVHAFGPLPIGTGIERPQTACSWQDKIRWIKGELDRREEDYPELVRKGRMTKDAAAIGVRVMATLRRIYWNRMFMWDPEPGPALDWIRHLRTNAAKTTAELEAILPGAHAEYLKQARAHLAAIEAEEAGQGRLVA